MPNFTVPRNAKFSYENHPPDVEVKLSPQKKNCKVLSFAILPFFFLKQLHCDLLADISTQDFLWEKDIALYELVAVIF